MVGMVEVLPEGTSECQMKMMGRRNPTSVASSSRRPHLEKGNQEALKDPIRVRMGSTGPLEDRLRLRGGQVQVEQVERALRGQVQCRRLQVGDLVFQISRAIRQGFFDRRNPKPL